MTELSREDILRFLGGSADDVGNELAEFSASAMVLSSDKDRLLDRHSEEWVGIFQGVVAASDADFPKLMEKLADAGVPASETIVRFIDTKEKTFIL